MVLPIPIGGQKVVLEEDQAAKLKSVGWNNEWDLVKDLRGLQDFTFLESK